MLLLGYRWKRTLRGDEPHILSGSVRRHHLLRSDGRGKFRESPFLGERTQEQWGGTKIDIGFTLNQDIVALRFSAVFKSYPVCMLILSQSHVRWWKNVPVTWSDEKLILLYCPGRGSNSRPSAHRGVNMIKVSYALTTRPRRRCIYIYYVECKHVFRFVINQTVLFCLCRTVNIMRSVHEVILRKSP